MADEEKKDNELGTPEEIQADVAPVQEAGYEGLAPLEVSGTATTPTDWNEIAATMLASSLTPTPTGSKALGGFAGMSPKVLQTANIVGDRGKGVLAAISGLSAGLSGQAGVAGTGKQAGAGAAGVSKKDALKMMTDLRKEKRDTLKETTEYRKEFAPYRETLSTANRAIANIEQLIGGDKTESLSSGDLGALYSYFDLLNPRKNANIREVMSAAEQQSFVEKLSALKDYFSKEGTLLAPKQKPALRAAARELYGTLVDRYMEGKQEMEAIAERNQLDAPTIIGKPKIFTRVYEDYREKFKEPKLSEMTEAEEQAIADKALGVKGKGKGKEEEKDD